MVKNSPAKQETRFLGWEEPLEKEMATHSNSLAWGIPQTEEPGGLLSMGSSIAGHNWVTKQLNPHQVEETACSLAKQSPQIDCNQKVDNVDSEIPPCSLTISQLETCPWVDHTPCNNSCLPKSAFKNSSPSWWCHPGCPEYTLPLQWLCCKTNAECYFHFSPFFVNKKILFRILLVSETGTNVGLS